MAGLAPRIRKPCQTVVARNRTRLRLVGFRRARGRAEVFVLGPGMGVQHEAAVAPPQERQLGARPAVVGERLLGRVREAMLRKQLR